MSKKPKTEEIKAAIEEIAKTDHSDDGVALTNISHPKGDYEDGRLYVYDGGAQVFLPHSVLSEDSIVEDSVEVFLTDVQTIFLKNELALMKGLHLVIKQTIGDYESLRSLDECISETEKVLNA